MCAGSGAEALGSAKNPLHMMQAEPTARAQLWRTFRTLALALLIMSGLGALVEERGLSRGILNNPDMRPQTDTRTRFADVKGVDEAKVRCRGERHAFSIPLSCRVVPLLLDLAAGWISARMDLLGMSACMSTEEVARGNICLATVILGDRGA